MARARGTGSIFKRGRIYWYSFERDGVLVRESSRSPLKTVAQTMLDEEIKKSREGFVKTDATVADFMEAALAEYDRQGHRSLKQAKMRWRSHIAPAFGSMAVARVTTDKLEAYAKARVGSGAAKATVNREFALLRFAFNFARKRRKIQLTPHFPMFRENNTRTGFLEDGQYTKLANACAKRGLGLRAMFEVAYTFGWRSSEVATMKVKQADLAAKTLRLEPNTTKNDEGREAVMTPRLAALVESCATGKRPEDALFDGTNFRKLWYAATKEAGFAPKDEKTKRPGLLFHDLRRTAVRNMIRRGIPERVAMQITGHKTRAVFDRYAIVAPSDLQEAARKMSLPLSEMKPTIDTQSEDFHRSGDGKMLN